MLDTKGPEIRTGRTKDKKKVRYKRGDVITLTSDYDTLCDSQTLSLSYSDFPTRVNVGQPIRIGDGALNVEVVSVEEATQGRVKALVLNDAEIGDRKNCNIPGVKVGLPILQSKDEHDLLEFALPHGVDLVALSFVQDSESVLAVRKLLEENCAEGQVPPLLISKIENGEGLMNFDSILEASDGIMVARGDLGMEIPPENVFVAQKMMIAHCNRMGKPVVTATQMLESMCNAPRPTRAEASDVANAVLDGSDCVMLSGETAAGGYPVEAVTIMRKVCQTTENILDYPSLFLTTRTQVMERGAMDPVEAVCSSAVKASIDARCKLIVALTETGHTARVIAKYRPKATILAITASESTVRHLQVCRGVLPVLTASFVGTDSVIAKAITKAKEDGLVAKGDHVVAVHGTKEESAGHSNLLKMVQVP